MKKIFNMIRKPIYIIMIGTLLSNFLGLIRDSILARYYGASLITDSYIISTTIPSIIIGAIATAILSTYIPILNEAKKSKDDKKFTNNFVNINIIFVTILMIIYFIFNKQIVSLFIIGFSGKKLDTVINMTNITVFASYFLILISIFSGYLQDKGRFNATSLYGVIFNVVLILGIIISAKYNSNIMAYSFILGYAISTIVLIINSVGHGYKYNLVLNLKDKYIKKIVKLTLPVIFNSVVWDINVIIDKSLISTVGTGYVSALNYSYKIINVAIGVVATSIAVYIFPKISQYFQNKSTEEFENTVTRSINLVLMLLIPIFVFMFIFAEDIVRILFMRGEFDVNALRITKNSLQLYSLAIIPIGINTILYKVFNSMQKNKIPAINSIISVIINIILNIILIKYYSYKGVIIATAISNFIAMVMILIISAKKSIKINYKELMLLKIIVAVIPAILASILFSKISGINIYLKLFIEGIIYVLIYYIILMIQKLKIKDVMV